MTRMIPGVAAKHDAHHAQIDNMDRSTRGFGLHVRAHMAVHHHMDWADIMRAMKRHGIGDTPTSTEVWEWHAR